MAMWNWGQQQLTPVCFLMALYERAHRHGEQVVLVFENGRQELVEEVGPHGLRLYSQGSGSSKLTAQELDYLKPEQFRVVEFRRLPVALGGQSDVPIDAPRLRVPGYVQASVTE